MANEYKPDPAAAMQSVEDLLAYMVRENQRISDALASKLDTELPELKAPPAKPRERQLVVADGKVWDPGSGKGPYIYLDGKWLFLAGSGPTSLPQPPEPDPISTTPPEPLPPESGFATPTFHCMGLVWRPPSDPGAAGATLEYRKKGVSTWSLAQSMWYDNRNGECRGSVFYLDSNTDYEFQFTMPGGSPLGSATGKTWNEIYPEDPVVTRIPDGVKNTPLIITQGGTPNAYKVYTSTTPGGATIDVKNGYPDCIEVRAPYVIIRDLIVTGGQKHAIEMFAGVHDVLIEKCDISNWGRLNSSMSAQAGFNVAVNYDDGIHALQVAGLERIIIQYNKIHDPRYGSNSWAQGHPSGAQAIGFHQDQVEIKGQAPGRNHVFRWNTIQANLAEDYKKFFNDSLGGNANFSQTGYPGAESDIYGNFIQGGMDDAIEAEGGGNNVRIWGNYIDLGHTGGIASTVVHWGPCYIFRNVYDRGRQYWGPGYTWDNDPGGQAFKAASHTDFGNGRRFVFHNTLLQRSPLPGASLTMGYGIGLAGLTTSEPLTNTRSRNNILCIKKNWHSSIQAFGGANVDCDYDLYNGVIDVQGESHGIHAPPTYKSGHGNNAGRSGKYQLEVGTPGKAAGEVLPNINDNFPGAAPDMGAHEEGAADMVFGHLGTGKGAGAP